MVLSAESGTEQEGLALALVPTPPPPFAFGAMAMGVTACIGYAAHVASGVGGTSVAVILLALALGGAVVACAVAALERSPARNAWRLLALALAAYGLTSITYTVVPNVAGNFPSVYDLGLFAFYPLAFAALIAFVRRRVIGFSAALWIDSIVGAVVVAALGATVIWPLLDGPLGLAVVGQLLFFLGDLGFLGFLLAAYALSGWRDASSLGFLAGGAALLTIADGVWVVDVAGGAAAPGLLPSFLWPAAVLVLAIAPYGQVRAVALSTYAAKRAGKGHYEFFEPRMHEAVVARTKLIRDLGGAVENSLAAAALPAPGRPVVWADDGRRGARALAASPAWPAVPRPVHPGGGEHRDDRRHRRLGHARGMHAAARLGRCRRRAA